MKGEQAMELELWKENRDGRRDLVRTRHTNEMRQEMSRGDARDAAMRLQAGLALAHGAVHGLKKLHQAIGEGDEKYEAVTTDLFVSVGAACKANVMNVISPGSSAPSQGLGWL